MKSSKYYIPAIALAFSILLSVGGMLLTIKATDYVVGLMYKSRPLRPLELEAVVFDWYPFSVGHMAANMNWKGIEVNRMGYWYDRGFDLADPPPKPAGEYRILLIGGSGAQGQGGTYENENMLYSRIEARLNKSLQPVTGKHYRVINVAMGGSRTYHNFVDMNLIGHNLSPDMILSYSGFNDWSVPYHFEYNPQVFTPPKPRTAWDNIKYLITSIYAGILNPDMTLRTWFRPHNPFTNDIREFSRKHAKLYATRRDFFEDQIIPLYANALRSMKRDFPNIPIVVARQAIENSPDEFGPYGAPRSSLGLDFYDRMFEKVSQAIEGYQGDNWLIMDPHKVYERDPRWIGFHLTTEAQDLIGDYIGWRIAFFLHPEMRDINPDVAAAIDEGTYRLIVVPSNIPGAPENWHERAYLDGNPDVLAAVVNGLYASGYAHYVAAGKKEGRFGSPDTWDEDAYLTSNPDVKSLVEAGVYSSGLRHYLDSGRAEGRKSAEIKKAK